MSDKMVMRDDPEAATQVSVTGWRSRNGFFYGDNEDSARFDGCTHVSCAQCGTPVEKAWTVCRRCRDLEATDRYASLQRAAWDGEAMLYSQTLDQYFASPDGAKDALMGEQALADLRLVICTPNRGQPLSEDYFSDDLADDADEELPACLIEAIGAFNEALANAPVLSWSPGKFALLLTRDQ